MTPTRTSVRRCPACGQRLTPPVPSHCPLCSFDFHDDRVTGQDVTPYARAYSFGQSGWQRMGEWVWFSGAERLKHLALMRSSAASRRFAWLNVLLLALGLSLFQGTQVGWRWVTQSAATESSGSTQPAGDGWIHVAAAPRPLPSNLAPEISVDLWWNPWQSCIAVLTSFAAGVLLLWLALYAVRAGVTRAHAPAYRGESRMSAAIHYGTAWVVPLFLATLVLGLSPVSYIGAMAQWSWYPPRRGLVIGAGVLAGFGAIMGWFWLARLGMAAPARTRRRVAGFFVLGASVIAAVSAAAWWRGLNWLHDLLFDALRLTF